MVRQPVLHQLDLAVRGMEARQAFSRRLGFVIDAPTGAEHVPLHHRADGDVP